MKHSFLRAFVGILLVAASPRAQVPVPPASVAESDVKASFLKLLDRPRVPLDVRSLETKPPWQNVISERIEFAVEARGDGSMERVPALVARPDWAKPGDRLPAVVVLHGTGGRKEASWPWLAQLAHRGMIAIAIDGRYHGDRIEGPHDPKVPRGTKAYNDAIVAAWRSKPGEPQAHPFFYDTCWDIWRTVDYLQSRGDVDPDRIGMIGISKGGVETWLAAAVDDRVKVAIPAISVQSFRWSLEHDHWQGRANTIKDAHEAVAADLGEPAVNAKVCRSLWNKVIPGILDEFDAPSMLRLFNGRSLLILNGDRDANCPIEGAELAFASARAAFRQVEREDHLKIIVAKDSGHILTREQHDAALDWFLQWLKPDSPPPGAVRFHRPRSLFVGPPNPDAKPTDRPKRPAHPRLSRRPAAPPANPVTAPVPTPPQSL